MQIVRMLLRNVGMDSRDFIFFSVELNSGNLFQFQYCVRHCCSAVCRNDSTIFFKLGLNSCYTLLRFLYFNLCPFCSVKFFPGFFAHLAEMGTLLGDLSVACPHFFWRLFFVSFLGDIVCCCICQLNVIYWFNTIH